MVLQLAYVYVIFDKILIEKGTFKLYSYDQENNI